MSINEVIAHLKMLGFKKHLHPSTTFSYFKIINRQKQIIITISRKRMAINIRTPGENEYKTTRTNHTEGLRYLAKFLYNLEQETEQK